MSDTRAILTAGATVGASFEAAASGGAAVDDREIAEKAFRRASIALALIEAERDRERREAKEREDLATKEAKEREKEREQERLRDLDLWDTATTERKAWAVLWHP